MYLDFIFENTLTLTFVFRHQEDYRRTVTEIDEKEYISLKIIVSELRNQYVCCGFGLLSPSIHVYFVRVKPEEMTDGSARPPGNVTRYDPEEYREDQEASKQ